MAAKMLIVDSHQDLAWNMLTFGRDYTRSAAETRRLEVNSETPLHNGDTLLGWPDFQRGQVAIIFGTLFATPAHRQDGAYDIQVYANTTQAYGLYRTQLDEYHRLVEEHPDKFRLLETRKDLEAVLSHWQEKDRGESEEAGEERGHPVGLVALMEGAEGVRAPEELEDWWARGLRIIGPSWAGTRFAGGTREPGPLTRDGYALLDVMASLGFSLDLSHMDEKAALQALDYYPGRIIATHANAQALLKGVETNRHLTDRVIQGIIERDGVIGAVPNNPFLLAGWKRGDPRELVSLDRLVAQIDYVCQMAGDARHAGIGSDFDGGFGLQSTPIEIDTIADLQKLIPLLAEKGYNEQDIAAILGENWLNHLRQLLPESV